MLGSSPLHRMSQWCSRPGGGKTELIARATCFASETAGRQLILTHTHAGVHALRARLARLGVAPQSYTLTTIAGWALKWALHYPSVSGLRITQPDTPDEWNAVYEGRLSSSSESPPRI